MAACRREKKKGKKRKGHGRIANSRPLRRIDAEEMHSRSFLYMESTMHR